MKEDLGAFAPGVREILNHKIRRQGSNEAMVIVSVVIRNGKTFYRQVPIE